MYGVRQAIKEEQERVRREQQKASAKRKARGDKISRQKDIQDLYARESKKRFGMLAVGGKESPEYKKRMSKLKLMAEGRKIPLEMRDVFGS